MILLLLTMAQATVAFATIAQGSDSLITGPREVVARSADQWQILWKEHSREPAPDVDFSTSMVAGVFLGTRPTAGYRVDVAAVTIEGKRAVVEYTERTPGPEDLVAQVVTAPFHLIRLPRSIGEIEFRKREK